MKIAIVFSGRLDKYLETYQNIFENVVRRPFGVCSANFGNVVCTSSLSRDVDFFLSQSKAPYISYKMNEFIKLYNPKIILQNDEPLYYFPEEKYLVYPETNIHNTMCMYFNRMKAGKFLNSYIEESSTNYDIVISYRIDLYASSILNLDSLLPEIKQGKVCIPLGNDHRGINDQIAIGKTEVVLTYLNLYESITDILDKGCIFNPELLLQNYLAMMDIKVFRFDFKYEIVR